MIWWIRFGGVSFDILYVMISCKLGGRGERYDRGDSEGEGVREEERRQWKSDSALRRVGFVERIRGSKCYIHLGPRGDHGRT
jgi:hypothetical protein